LIHEELILPIILLLSDNEIVGGVFVVAVGSTSALALGIWSGKSSYHAWKQSMLFSGRIIARNQNSHHDIFADDDEQRGLPVAAVATEVVGQDDDKEMEGQSMLFDFHNDKEAGAHETEMTERTIVERILSKNTTIWYLD
jgi:hypothetical protein